MIRHLRVVEVQIQGMKGYQIQGWYRDCTDSFWETIVHDAIFLDRAHAQRFLSKCGSRSSLNWNHWGKPFDYIHSFVDAIQTPVSVYTVIPRIRPESNLNKGKEFT